MDRRLRGSFTIAFILTSMACTPKAPTAAPQATGVVTIEANNPAADEGESWDIVVRPDGRYSVRSTWSDGAEAFSRECHGERPREEAARIFELAEQHALLDTRPHRVGEPDFEHLEVLLVYAQTDGTTRYVPLDVEVTTLRGWADSFIQDRQCQATPR